MKTFKKLFISIILVGCLVSLFTLSAFAHSGRTDSSGGHRDNKNASGLGPYHYHHGYGPHLHPNGICPYDTPAPAPAPAPEPKPSPAPALAPAPAPTPTPTPTPTISVYIDDHELTFDVPPTIENGRTLVPVRAIFEALGATVDYDANTKTVIAMKGNTTITLPIGKVEAKVNKAVKKLDAPSKIVNGRTLVPLCFVSEALGAEVTWDGKTKTIYIISQKQDPLI